MATRISRRRFLAGSAAAAAAVAAAGPLALRSIAAGTGQGERLVPPDKLSVQQFSIRDAITRRSIAGSNALGIAPTMGYLGGLDFPSPYGDTVR